MECVNLMRYRGHQQVLKYVPLRRIGIGIGISIVHADARTRAAGYTLKTFKITVGGAAFRENDRDRTLENDGCLKF